MNLAKAKSKGFVLSEGASLFCRKHQTLAINLVLKNGKGEIIRHRYFCEQHGRTLDMMEVCTDPKNQMPMIRMAF